jgi:hypothetical protein
MAKKSLWIAAGVAAGVASVFLPLSPVSAAPPTQNVAITNTAANPVPVTGTVDVGTVSGPISVVPAAPPVASRSYGIPIQSLTAGSSYEFTDARYAMKLSSVTVWSRELVEIAFSGPAPLVVTTDAPLAIPLTQPNQTAGSVKVTCLATSGSCRFQFWMLGS